MPRGTPPPPPEKPVRFSPGVPPPPPDLDDAGRAEYERVAKEAEENLQQVDASDLFTYAQGFSDVMRLTRLVREQGESLTSDKGNLYPNPNNNALQMAYTRMSKAADKLRFNPKSRDQGKTGKTGKGKDDPLGNFL